MKNFVLFVSLFLAWVAFDPSVFRKRRNDRLETEITLADDQNETEQEKMVQRQNRDVIPKRFRKKTRQLKSKCNHRSTKSRDSRDSNQRAIRRKFNNA